MMKADREVTLRGGAAAALPVSPAKAYGACPESKSKPALAAQACGALEEEDDEIQIPRCCSQGWPALWTVVLLDTLAGILMALVVPDLGAAYFGGGKDPCAGGGGGTPACAAAVGRFSSVSAAFGLASAVLTFLCGPVAGAAADTVGTKPILVLSILVKIVQALALMGVSWAGLSIYYLFGSMELAALVPTRLTFGLWVLENTAPSGRSRVYARLMAAQTIEGIVAPLASTLLNQRLAPAVIMAFSLAAFGSSLFCSQKDRPGKGARGTLPGAEQSIMARFDVRGVQKLFADPSTSLIVTLVLVGGICADGALSVWFFYLKEKFGMDMATLGPVVMVITLSNVVCQMFLVGPLEKLLGLRGVIMFSFASGICASVGYILAPSMKWLWFLSVFDGLSSLANPIMAALLTNVATEGGAGGDVGVSLGIVQSATSVTSIIGPLLFKLVFSHFLQPGRSFVGAVWVLALLLELIGMALTLRLPRAPFAHDCGS